MRKFNRVCRPLILTMVRSLVEITSQASNFDDLLPIQLHQRFLHPQMLRPGLAAPDLLGDSARNLGPSTAKRLGEVNAAAP